MCHYIILTWILLRNEKVEKPGLKKWVILKFLEKPSNCHRRKPAWRIMKLVCFENRIFGSVVKWPLIKMFDHFIAISAWSKSKYSERKNEKLSISKMYARFWCRLPYNRLS
jgi:hypothetical protein